MDECWTINIKSPASLTVHNGPVDERGFMVKVIYFRYFTISTICLL